jgi:hypothetical protein
MAVTARELRALDVCRPFSRAQAQAAGIRLREILGPEFHKILYDSYVSATVPSPTQTFLDLACSLDLVELVVLGDSLVKAKRVTPEDLVAAASEWVGNGVVRARRAARFARKGVDSPKETRLRMLLVLAGLPEPTVNVIIRNPDGSWRMRFDLSYPGLKLIIEYDGRQHAENSGQWRRDLSRREELDGLGWRLIVVTSDDLRDAPEAVLNRVRDALIDRGAVGIRRRFKTEWMRYFAPRT